MEQKKTGAYNREREQRATEGFFVNNEGKKRREDELEPTTVRKRDLEKSSLKEWFDILRDTTL